MLTTYPIKINNTSIPWPDSWDEHADRVANEFQTEAGTRQKIVVRSKRLTITANFTVSNRWLKKFEEWRDASTLTVSIYDAVSGGYVSHTMEITDDSFSYSLIKNSQRAGNTNGLWRLSFDLEEF